MEKAHHHRNPSQSLGDHKDWLCPAKRAVIRGSRSNWGFSPEPLSCPELLSTSPVTGQPLEQKACVFFYVHRCTVWQTRKPDGWAILEG